MPQDNVLYNESTPLKYRLNKKLITDNSTTKISTLEITPDNTTNLNSTTGIRFQLKDPVNFLDLSSENTGLEVRAKFRTQWKPAAARAAGDPWVNNATNAEANITLANAWFGHLFDNVLLKLGGQEIELINEFGTVFESLCHMRSLEYRNGSGSKESYIPDSGTSDTANANLGHKERVSYYNYPPADADTFREVTIFVPLNSIFGFCKDHERILRNIPIDITFTRVGDFSNCFLGAAHTNVEFEVTNMLLRIECVTPNDKLLVGLNDFIQSHDPFEAYYQAKSCDMYSGRTGTTIDIQVGLKYSFPRFIIIAAKDPAKNQDKQQNFGKLENGDIRNIKVTVGSNKYPDVDQSCDFKVNNFMRFYNSYDSLCKEFGNVASITPKDFKNIYSVFAFDTSAQPEIGKNQPTHIMIKITRNSAATIPSLNYYAIIIYDKYCNLHYKEGRVSLIG